jgi:hypothetical protein
MILLVLLAPCAGLGWFLMGILRMVVARIERVFLLGGLTLALSLPSPFTAQLSQGAATHDVQMALSWVLAVLGTVLLGAGATRPWLKRVRHVLRRRGWSF